MPISVKRTAHRRMTVRTIILSISPWDQSTLSTCCNKHPELCREFMNGNHTVLRAKSNAKFNTGSTDMALEQSLNKDTKTKGRNQNKR